MNKQRRNFITGSLATVAGLATVDVLAEPQAKKGLIHHVFFWLNSPDSKADREKLLEGLQSLRNIKSLRDFQLGVPAATEARDVIDNSYSFSLYTVFDDIKGHDAYQVDPIHTRFVENYKHLWKKVTVYDVQSINP